MNLIAHILFSIILCYIVRATNTPPTIPNLLFDKTYIAALIGSIIIDLDHIPYMGKALKTKRFSPHIRSRYHELFGFIVFGSISLLIYMIIDKGLGLGFYIGITTHYLLDTLTRPTRPFFPYNDTIMFYGLAPRKNLKDLAYFDLYVTLTLAIIYLYIIGYNFLLPLTIPFIILFLYYSIVKADKVEDEAENELYRPQLNGKTEPRRLEIAVYGKIILEKIFRGIAFKLSKIHPDKISGISLFLSIFIPIFLIYRYTILAIILLFLVLILDALDGLVARIRGLKRGIKGWIVDLGTDRFSEAIISISSPHFLLPLTLLNTALSIYSLKTNRHIIIPVRQLYLFFLIITLFDQNLLFIIY
ncbi:MAG: hypothetical protein B6U89_05605 [Desulfurococcales archaeon ex4484_58]|nr:MAG: hypothetical protein B6U89_05605 [Desulfurococcales archaeon ex4484_58]